MLLDLENAEDLLDYITSLVLNGVGNGSALTWHLMKLTKLLNVP